jgi:signal transduction histidine kinase
MLSHKLELAFNEIDLNQLIEETIREIKGLISTSITQNLETLPPVSIDCEHMHKVIDNLLINANDALGQEGQINVRTSCNNKWVEIAVRDNGCGMSGEFIKKNLFRPFRTTKKHGMGIGLYHCKAIVEAHKGRIEVESEEGKGSIFRVLLPVNIK